MMKAVFVFAGFLFMLGFSNCGPNKVVYTIAEDKFIYDRDSLPYGRQKILQESFVSFSTYEFKEGKEPLKFYIRLNGIMPKINSIEKISLELLQKNEKGQTIAILPRELQEFKVEYSNGKSIISLPVKNEHIGEQVNWREADWGEYTKNNSVVFVGTFVFEPIEFSPTMIMKFKIIWQDGEKKFETTLTKGDYVGPKLNPKF
jgi:hypothetical protein